MLTATATRADADADTVLLSYVWKVNGTIRKTTPATSSLTDTFNLSQTGNGDAGDAVTVEVTPNDGTADGAVASDSAVVDAAPAPPTGLTATLSTRAVTLDWTTTPRPISPATTSIGRARSPGRTRSSTVRC